ncbi:RING-H2 finger protein ATL8 [Abeliophyllum distichum]|uniref:RING-H2 finger protein ATL8 n=1 Tax=Abeliophyllum distichum TaxID=126358 RepID=A0ABD1QXS0_9LAMI
MRNHGSYSSLLPILSWFCRNLRPLRPRVDPRLSAQAHWQPPAPAAAATTTTTSTVLKVQNSLIDVTYTASSFPNTNDCAICLESFVEEDECRSLQTCKHLFHTECMDNWVERKLTCPICRTRVFLYPGLSSCSRISFEDRWKMFYLTVFEDDTYY